MGNIMEPNTVSGPAQVLWKPSLASPGSPTVELSACLAREGLRCPRWLILPVTQ